MPKYSRSLDLKFPAASESSDGDSSSPNAMVLRNQDGTMTVLQESAAGACCGAQSKFALSPYMYCLTALYLQSRSFQGLEARIGEDGPSILEQGRSGIARGYADDRPTSDAS